MKIMVLTVSSTQQYPASMVAYCIAGILFLKIKYLNTNGKHEIMLWVSMYDVASWKTIVRAQSKCEKKKTFSTVVEHTSYYYFAVGTVTFDVLSLPLLLQLLLHQMTNIRHSEHKHLVTGNSNSYGRFWNEEWVSGWVSVFVLMNNMGMCS